MKIKTLSKIPFIVSWVISIPILGFILKASRSFLVIKTSNIEYIITLMIFSVVSIILFKLFTGVLNINLDKEQIEIEWSKKPFFTKIERQVVELNRIKEVRIYNSRISDGLIIFLSNGEKIKIHFNNLIDYRKNNEKRKVIINYFKSKNIYCS